MDKEKTLLTLNSFNKNTLMETLKIEFVDVGVDFVTANIEKSFQAFFSWYLPLNINIMLKKHTQVVLYHKRLYF